MLAFFSALIPILGGFTQPLKDYFASKTKQAELTQQLEIARLQAEKEAVVSGNESQVKTIQNYLTSVSRNFRQGTFYFLMVPFLISMFAPEYAKIMWQNFEAIPLEFKQLFILIYGVIWGLPIAKEHVGNMFSAISRGLAAHREYRLDKAEINRDAAFIALKAKWFSKNGMNQKQVNEFNEILDAGEK